MNVTLSEWKCEAEVKRKIMKVQGMRKGNRDARSEMPRVRHLTMFESEFQVLAGISARERSRETGFEFMGAWSNRDLPIIQLVVGPGPGAIHQPCRYEQDVEFLCRVHDTVVSEHGIEWIGGGHCHHTLGLRGQSCDDIRQVTGVTTRNDLKRWCEIITTFADVRHCPRTMCATKAISTEARSSLLVQADAYLYTDPQRGERTQVPIRVVPGVSPIRKAVLASGSLSPADIGEYASGFPMRSILYDSVSDGTEDTDLLNGVFEAIAVHCRELPEESQRGITIAELQDSVMVTLPLSSCTSAYVEYNRNAPHEIMSVKVGDDQYKTEGSIADVLGSRRAMALGQVCSPQPAPKGRRSEHSHLGERLNALFEAATHVATKCIRRVRDDR